ncbi:MAG: hypothetical protein HYR56_21130 [Acidobacteria bacterium]|nr:hypothetical protein [Acidobacteriota bacterium]MBI3428111.1 hypothetical protein [Acidobacteriota bacterium]
MRRFNRMLLGFVCVLTIFSTSVSLSAHHSNQRLRPKAQSVPAQTRGSWTGRTAQDLPIKFAIDEQGRVVNLEVDYRMSFSGLGTCVYKLCGFTTTISNNQFDAEVGCGGIAFVTGEAPRARGTFSSATAMTGSISNFRVGFAQCGGGILFGSVSISGTTFSAQQQPDCHTISGINPASGSVGTAVTLTGTNLIGVSAVKFNNITATFTVNNATQITAQVPTGATTGPITVGKTNCTDFPTAAFTVQTQAPLTTISAASFLGTELTAESIAAGFGQGLATTTASANASPLPTALAGTNIKVKDSAGAERPAPLFFVSPGQINYLIPAGTANGTAIVTVMRDNTISGTGTVTIATVAPGLFAANANGQGLAAAVALRVKADNSQSFEPLVRFDQASNRFVAVPLDLGPATDRVFLLLFGTGFRNRSALAAVSARLGGATAEVSFAGAQGDLAGLDQANVLLPRSLAGRGEIDAVLTVDGKTANTVRVNIGGTAVNPTPSITNASLNKPDFASGVATLSGRFNFTDADGDIAFNGALANSAKLRFRILGSAVCGAFEATGAFLNLSGQTAGTVNFTLSYNFRNAVFLPSDVEVQLVDLAGNASAAVRVQVEQWFCQLREWEPARATEVLLEPALGRPQRHWSGSRNDSSLFDMLGA